MDKNELLKICRYYHGENKDPFRDNDRSMLWMYEKSWVMSCLKDKNDKTIRDYIDEYVTIGLATFRVLDGVPTSLKALLFNRYARMYQSLADASEPFKKFYEKYYPESE